MLLRALAGGLCSSSFSLRLLPIVLLRSAARFAGGQPTEKQEPKNWVEKYLFCCEIVGHIKAPPQCDKSPHLRITSLWRRRYLTARRLCDLWTTSTVLHDCLWWTLKGRQWTCVSVCTCREENGCRGWVLIETSISGRVQLGNSKTIPIDRLCFSQWLRHMSQMMMTSKNTNKNSLDHLNEMTFCSTQRKCSITTKNWKFQSLFCVILLGSRIIIELMKK